MPTNIEFDPINEVIITQKSANYTVVKFEKSANGNFIALTDDNKIISYDQALNSLSQASSLTSLNVKIYAFTTRNDSVFVAGNNPVAGTPYYAVLSSAFNILHSSQPAYKGIIPRGIAVTDKNQVSIVTEGSSSTTQVVTFTSVYNFAVNGGFSSSRDIGVVSVKGLNSIINHPNIYKYMPVADLEATVKNFGTDTVKTFYLNSYYANSFCPFVFHKLYHITIAPGATVSVQTGTFIIQSSIVTAPSSPYGSTIKTKMCLFTTVPDYANDIEINNDAACDSVLFTITSIEEKNLLFQRMQIYPNPFTNNFTVSSDFEIKTLKLINSLGSLIRSEVVNSRKYDLNADSLPLFLKN